MERNEEGISPSSVGHSTINSENLSSDEHVQDDINGNNTQGVSNKAYISQEGNNFEENKETGQDGGDGDKPKEQPKMVGTFELFRYSDCLDIFLMLFGTIASLGNGISLPLMIVVFGQLVDSFTKSQYTKNFLDELLYNISTNYPNIDNIFPNLNATVHNNPNFIWNVTNYLNITDNFKDEQTNMQNGEELLNSVSTFVMYFSLLGVYTLLLGYIQLCFWQMSSTRQTHRIRTNLLRSILRQEIGWFDTQSPGTLNTRLSDDVQKISDGTGEKMAMILQQLAQFIAGFVVGFVNGWKLTLVILSVVPLLALSFAAVNRLLATMTSKELKAYAKAGAVAEEVLSSIRTVTALGGQNKECLRYNNNLNSARLFGIKKGIVKGISTGLVFFVMFNIYALAFWYGSKLVREDSYTAGSLMIVFFGVVIAAVSIGNAAPNMQDVSSARGAAHIVFSIINRVPSIDSFSSDGIKPEDFIGNIEFRDVVFRYPSRPTIPILQGLSLKVKVGQTVALVGSSGCGKSTTVQLLQRFYDPISGQVLIDGKDVKSYNIKWLRQHIGVVSQEPVLFASSIAENIRFGRDGISDEEIELAARQANVHDFISKLPKKYNTLVGERGAQLSGGQKQRIAIARALVRNPKILLLDEATSALDNESEAIVQDALDKARLGRTTIVIAHRLSTIQTADVIIGVKEGVVAEEGTHGELMELGGLYHTLVTNQTKPSEETDDIEEETNVNLARVTSLKRDMPAHKIVPGAGEIDKMSLASEKLLEENVPDVGYSRVLKMNAPEWHYIFFGCIAAIAAGLQMIAFALLFSSIIGAFSIIDKGEQETEINRYCMIFCILSIIFGIAMVIMSYMLAVSGENLTIRVRETVFRTMLRQEIAFFDKPENNTGALCTKLAIDASAVQGATGARIGMLFQSMSSIIAALVIGFVYSWRLALIILAFAPFMIVSGAIRAKFIYGKKKGAGGNAAFEEGGKVATEAIENIRTVATLTKENHFHEQYCFHTGDPYRHELRMSHLHGLAYGFSQGIIFFAYAASFYAGSHFVYDGINTFEDILKVFMALVFGTMSAGQASSFAPDYGKAKLAAARVFALIDRVPAIDNLSDAGEIPKTCHGEVTFQNVHFCYPTRPDVQVLRGIDITARPGQRIALVGSSGCGKSTTVQLLERFYDPLQGQVVIDNSSTTSLNINWLRSQIGLVSQEPILFSCSIRDNIAYGDNLRQISMEEIIEVAKMANIHSFISSLPKGYDTEVGDKGTQLSGGQKQRIAIARALVRNPKILLLDEATSALDTESEKIVQEALDKAQQGRTSIVIAHRLSTIHDADLIVCMKNGKVLEQGKHSELMSLKGFYYRLNMAQLKK